MTQMHWTVHLDGESGTDVSVPKIFLHATVAVGHKVYAFGGFGYTRDRDQIYVHIFDTISLRWMKLAYVTRGNILQIPSNRIGHTAVLIGDIIYLWGGLKKPRVISGGVINEFNCNILYGFHVDSHRWFKPKTSGTVPEGRYGHSACVLGNVLYIYGGDNQLGCKNDIYRLDTTTMVWSLINTTGLASAYHSATFIGTKIFVFGGWGALGQHYYNNIRVFDTENNDWLSMPSAQCPEEENRSKKACISALQSAFAYNGELYITFAGSQSMWNFNPKTFSWRKVEPKGKRPREWCVMGCCCMVGEHVMFFKGNPPCALYMLDLNPSLKTLCKLAVIQGGLEQSELPHTIRWELEAMTSQKIPATNDISDLHIYNYDL